MDNSMKFQLGHKLAKGGKRIGSGPKKSVDTIMKESIENDRGNLPAYFETLRYKALVEVSVKCPQCSTSFSVPGGGDKECLFYLIDRQLGKAKQFQDLRVRASRVYSADELELMALPLIEEKKNLKEWGKTPYTDEEVYNLENDPPTLNEQGESEAINSEQSTQE